MVRSAAWLSLPDAGTQLGDHPGHSAIRLVERFRDCEAHDREWLFFSSQLAQDRGSNLIGPIARERARTQCLQSAGCSSGTTTDSLDFDFSPRELCKAGARVEGTDRRAHEPTAAA